MPKATGSLDTCKKTYLSLEKETDSLLEEFIGLAEKGQVFFKLIDRAETQLALAERRAKGADLELNEIAVLADKVGSELDDAEKEALGAALLECEADWAVQFESARKILDRMATQTRRLEDFSGKNEGMESRSAILSFSRDALACKMRLGKLRAMLSSRNGSTFIRLEAARRRMRRLRAGIGKASDRLAKARLKDKIAKAKAEIAIHMEKSGKCRLVLDHKHLTIMTETGKTHIPLTQTVRFALEEMAPIEKSISKLGKSGMAVVGRFEKGNGGAVLTIGERTILGDTIVCKQKSYRLN